MADPFLAYARGIRIENELGITCIGLCSLLWTSSNATPWFEKLLKCAWGVPPRAPQARLAWLRSYSHVLVEFPEERLNRVQRIWGTPLILLRLLMRAPEATGIPQVSCQRDLDNLPADKLCPSHNTYYFSSYLQMLRWYTFQIDLL